MQFTKAYYRTLAIAPYWYAGFWDGLHHYTKGDNRKGFKTVACTEEDTEDGNLEYFMTKGLTR